MSIPLLLGLNDDSLRKIFSENKRLLKGLQLCKDVRKVLLRGLSFAQNDLPHLVVKDIEILKGRMQRSPSLHGKWMLEPEGINLLVRALDLRRRMSDKKVLWLREIGLHSVFPSLKSITLRGNWIGNAVAASLGETIKHLASLQSLDVSYNNIREAGAANLREAIKHYSSLQSLCRLECSLQSLCRLIREAGMTSLGEAIKHYSSLQSLDLSGNQIGEAGVAIPGEAIKQHSSLQSLDVSSNYIGE